MILRHAGGWKAAIAAPTWMLALLFAAPAAGDWLVLRDGSRLETAGPWEVKGRQIVFTRPGGALSAVRLADVDLDASNEATRAANAEPAAASEQPAETESRRRRPVLVLTDETLGGAGSGVLDDSEIVPEVDETPEGDETEDDASLDGEEAEDDASETSDSATDPVYIVSWSEQESTAIDGLEIVGKVRNRGRDVAADIRVQVKASDEDGSPFVDTRAFLQKSSLAPGHTTTFRALLPGIYALLEDPTFDVTSEGFTMQLVTESEDEEGEEADGGEAGGVLGVDGYDDFPAPNRLVGDDELGDYDEVGDDDEFGDDDDDETEELADETEGSG